MRSKVAQKMLDNTPEDIKLFVGKYGDLIFHISSILKEKGWSQKTFAKKMDKAPSEINKWLSGNHEHNLTLRSIAKMEAELGVSLLEVPLNNRKIKTKEIGLAMNDICPICQYGEMTDGESTVAIEQKGTLVIFKQVPSKICSHCTRYILDEKTNLKLVEKAKQVAGKGTEMEVLKMVG